ncbi:type II toxin-antitoxin system RelE/ParE family toxin [Methylobacterium sp. BTF04]|uniref:type II toxin-antitoxin system RelE family toxin n=1 Tax=Methylobacterium sp. BTF04 TaxID=2708300 RepID=UPI0013D8549E|nr:type II toxin-antitoxin system RelE/ParE family toxin [Methylobacterium sp. BTF04]NEU13979.1 type II toxin-antitoxin system RelE/ParE family toxin [Methylobacterium sp. BTF04]
MAWRIEFERSAERDLAKLDAETAKRILRFLRDRVSPSDDPPTIGEALKRARLGSFWKYRVGDCRVIAAIEAGALRILVVKVGNRREVYR